MVNIGNIHLPENGKIPVLSEIAQIIRALSGPLLRYDARANAVNEVLLQGIYNGSFVDSGHGFIPKLEDIKTFGEMAYYSDLQQRIINLEQNLNQAFNILALDAGKIEEQTSENPKKELNLDWFARWRQVAEVTSDKDMQKMWGRILAEETQEPGTISLRTLDTLKNITAREANLFVQISTFILNDILVCSEHRLPPQCTFDNIVDLVDAGLLTNTDIVRHHGIQDVSGFRLFEGEGYWLSIQCRRKANPVSGMALSKVGREILKISDRQSATREEITKICDIIRSGAVETKIESMKAVLPGTAYAAPEESILYRYPYISRRRKK